MSTKRIPPESWTSFFESFTRQHHGWLVTVDTGADRVAEQQPLDSIRAAGGDIEIRAGDSHYRVAKPAVVTVTYAPNDDRTARRISDLLGQTTETKLQKTYSGSGLFLTSRSESEHEYARALLTPQGNQRFMTDFVPFQRRVAWFGMLNSLAQTLLKLTAPGVPDIYQGCELWQLSLVDPDNRRSVDYAPRRQALDAMRAAATGTGEALGSLAEDLLRHIDDGRIKEFVIWRALGLRRERAALFRDGTYVPLSTAGPKADHVCAYARTRGEDCAIVIVPRLACTLLGGESRLPLGVDVWKDTSVDISALPQRTLRDALTGKRVDAIAVQNGALRVAATLNVLPLALLVPDDL